MSKPPLAAVLGWPGSHIRASPEESPHQTQAGNPVPGGSPRQTVLAAPGTALRGCPQSPPHAPTGPVLSKSSGITADSSAWRSHGRSRPVWPVTTLFLPKPHLPEAPASPLPPGSPGASPSPRAPVLPVPQCVMAAAQGRALGKDCPRDSWSPPLSCMVGPQAPELYSLGSNLNLTTNLLSGLGQVI